MRVEDGGWVGRNGGGGGRCWREIGRGGGGLKGF